MRADSISYAENAIDYLGVQATPGQLLQLERFHTWLASEAINAGGIGPHEKDRLWRRHIADSLLLGIRTSDADSCLDIGSGVGLPGIPLAILFPNTAFTLLDRSGRRTHLSRRVISILGLQNCVVLEQDVEAVDQSYGNVVSRAALPVDRLVFHVKRLLASGGTAVVAYSRRETGAFPGLDIPGISVSVVNIPAEVLDTAVSLLRIEAT